MIRAVERDTGRPIGILVDLQGPKLRLGTFAGGSAMVKNGDTFVLDSDPAPGDAKRASTCRIRKFSPRSSPATRC